MIILVGASASGKTEISKILFQKYNYKKCITTTTRDKRINEVDGIDYHFKNKEAFCELISNDELVEYTIYQDNYYGFQKKDITENGVVILDPNGVNNLIKQYREIIYVVLVESSIDHRYERMIRRRDEIELIKKRIETDDLIFDQNHLLKIDLIITNNQEALEDLATQIHQNYQLFLNKINGKLEK